MFCDRSGKKMTLVEWSDCLLDSEYRVICEDVVGDYVITTSWIGISCADDSVPTFETMVFNTTIRSIIKLQRYDRENEALVGHNEMLEKYKSAVEYI